MHTPAGGLGAAADAAEVNWLAGDTAHAADLFGIKVLVRVGYPAHLSFAGAHVRGGDVEAGMNEVALGQLLREAARDFLQFVFGVISRINLERALGTAKRNEHDGALVGHESGECLDFVLIGKIGVADATFHRENMLAVYSAPTSEYFVAVVQLDAELELVAGVAASNLVGKARWQAHCVDGPVEHAVDAFTKSQFVGWIHGG